MQLVDSIDCAGKVHRSFAPLRMTKHEVDTTIGTELRQRVFAAFNHSLSDLLAEFYRVERFVFGEAAENH